MSLAVGHMTEFGDVIGCSLGQETSQPCVWQISVCPNREEWLPITKKVILRKELIVSNRPNLYLCE